MREGSHVINERCNSKQRGSRTVQNSESPHVVVGRQGRTFLPRHLVLFDSRATIITDEEDYNGKASSSKSSSLNRMTKNYFNSIENGFIKILFRCVLQYNTQFFEYDSPYRGNPSRYYYIFCYFDCYIFQFKFGTDIKSSK